MRAPEFWHSEDSLVSALLAPAGWAYGIAGRINRALTTPWKAPVPVICVGNLVSGGAGKTPVALDIARRLADRGTDPHFLSRGYGGDESGPHRVDPKFDNSERVGDEPLLLARTSPTWVSSDRAQGCRAAIEAGAGSVVMDDGFQNPGLAKDLSLLVFDGGYGIGNGRIVPAGPLREPATQAISRTDACVIIGDDATNIGETLAAARPDLPVFNGRLRPAGDWEDLKGNPVVAFAGIGRPAKFFDTLKRIGCELVERTPFPDHHPFDENEIVRLKNAATRRGALLVTTEKDMVRLPVALQTGIRALSVDLEWSEENRLNSLLDRVTR